MYAQKNMNMYLQTILELLVGKGADGFTQWGIRSLFHIISDVRTFTSMTEIELTFLYYSHLKNWVNMIQ